MDQPRPLCLFDLSSASENPIRRAEPIHCLVEPVLVLLVQMRFSAVAFRKLTSMLDPSCPYSYRTAVAVAVEDTDSNDVAPFSNRYGR